MYCRVILLLCATTLAQAAQAQTAELTGLLGGKALLVVDGGPPRSVAVGQSHLGVKVISTEASQAVVEIKGTRQTLRLGEAPFNAAAQTEGSDSRRIVLHAGSNGHFRAPGQINGQTVQFLVDTGASAVALGVTQADAIGLPYKSGERVQIGTANGVAVGWRIKLSTLRLGSVDVYNVDALVMPTSMPDVLLGNSYLTRFQMTRTNDQLVLERRY